MSFGRSANTKTASSNNAENRSESIFLDTKRGIRTFRIPHGTEEVKIKRHWLSLNPDGTWEPKFVYNANDKRRSIPVTVARWNADAGRWEGAERNWRSNPVDKWVATLDGVDVSKMYAQEIFYLNVLDLTPVRKGADGTVFYPDENMKYVPEAASLPKAVAGDIKLLSGSSSEPTGKSLYANLIRLAKSALNDEGDPISIYDFEIRLVTTGMGKETNRSFNMGTIRPMPNEYKGLKVYDLAKWPQVWPNEAIADLMQGADYAETVTRYNIGLVPDLVEHVTGAQASDDEELFS